MSKGSLPFILTLLLPTLALAHVPYFERIDFSEWRPFAVPKAVEQSIAVYAWLRSWHDLDPYTFEIGQEPAEVYVEVLVPVCPGYEEFAPWFALVGPSLPDPDSGLDLPFEVPPGHDVQVIPGAAPGDPRDSFYEPFGGKSYYEGDVFDEVLTAPGEYRIYVWDPLHGIGDYVGVIGKKEIWEASDILRGLILTPRIRQDRELHVECPR